MHRTPNPLRGLSAAECPHSTNWRETHIFAPNAVNLAGWNDKNLVATGAQADSALRRLEINDASRPSRFEGSAAAQLRTDLALAAS